MDIIKEYQDSGRLNLSGFTNLNKSAISEREFVEKYVQSKEYEIFSVNSIAEFKKAISDELIKGQYGSEELKLATAELGRLKHVTYRKADDTVIGSYVREIVKSNIDDNLEKGIVTDSFGSYSNNKMAFNKTGKEISTQITSVLIPLLEAQKIQIQTELNVISEGLTNEPDELVSEYSYRGFAKILPRLKRFSYDLCSYPETKSYEGVSTGEKAGNLERKYNQSIEMMISTMADIEYSKLLARNVEATKKYELTSDQVLALQF